MRLPDGRVRKLRRSSEDPGCAHELTFSCYQRLPLLGRDRTRMWFVDALDAARRRHSLELWGYVIMPEHVHVLFVPLDPAYRIRGVLQSIKQPVMRLALNSCGIAVLTGLASLAAGAFAGFALAFFPLRGKGAALGLALSVSMLPGISILGPLYLLIRAFS
jgi:ABC-type glycerol-3-phosphate transport system permease component